MSEAKTFEEFINQEPADVKKSHKDLARLGRIITWWHKRKFPTATKSGQLEKLKEELNELDEVCCEDLEIAEVEKRFYEELADCFIVIRGLQRFDKKMASEKEFNLGFNYGGDVVKLVSAIKDKMLINHKRDFAVKGKVFKHIGA